jgi:hypothetical protein
VAGNVCTRRRVNSFQNPKFSRFYTKWAMIMNLLKSSFVFAALIAGGFAALSASKSTAAPVKGTATGVVWVLYDCTQSTPGNPVLIQPDLTQPQAYVADGTQGTACPGGTQKYCAVKYLYNTAANSTSQLIYNAATDEYVFNAGYPGGRTAAKNFTSNGIVYCAQ